MITPLEIIVRLFLGVLFGGLIGFEREAHGRAAGFRTQLLVCVASVLIMIVSEYYHYLSVLDPNYVRVDPGRIAAGAVTGIGFLGAGVVIKSGLGVYGLTTAACIWLVSAIGLAVGSGLYLASTVCFLVTLGALLALRPVERKISSLVYRSITVIADDSGDESLLTSIIEKAKISVMNINYERDIRKGETSFHFAVNLKDKGAVRKVFDELSRQQFIKKVQISS